MLEKYEVTLEEVNSLGIEELKDLSIGEIYTRTEDEDGWFTVCTGWGAFYYALCPILEKRYIKTDIDVYFDGCKVDVTLDDLDYPLTIKEKAENDEASLITVIGRHRVVEFML